MCDVYVHCKHAYTCGEGVCFCMGRGVPERGGATLLWGIILHCSPLIFTIA